MVNWTSFRQLLPHYLAMIVVLMVVLIALGAAFPGLDYWVRLVVAVLVGLAYPNVARALGVAPEPWQ